MTVRADQATTERQAYVKAFGALLLEAPAEVVADVHAKTEAYLAAELVSVRQTNEELREALQVIAAWDCLNPPDTTLCADHPWLKAHVDAALAGLGDGQEPADTKDKHA